MYPMAKQYNKFAKMNRSIIQKALTSASGIGEAHIPQNLEKLYTDTVIRLSPELALVTAKKISGKVHEFNRVTERPSRGGANGENSTVTASNSKTVRDSVSMKVIKRKGKVTYFLADTSEEFLDVAAFEMEQHLQAHVLDLIYYMLYGNKDSRTYVNGAVDTVANAEFDGIEKMISTNKQNIASGSAVPTTLKFLDDMIDQSNRKGGARHVRAFGMSPEMLSLVSRLLTNVRLNQDYGTGLTQVDISGGWRLNAYRNIPIIETTSTRPVEKMSSVVTTDGVNTGGSLSNGSYYVYVAPVTYEGEQEACTEEAVTLSGGTATQRIRISLDAPHKTASGISNALSYRIYAGTTTGVSNCPLVKIVSAFMYDSDLSALDATVDANNNGVGTNYIYLNSLTPDSSVPASMQGHKPFIAVGSIVPESVYLWDTDPIQGLGKMPYANTAGDQFNGLVTTKRLAEIEDYIHFLVKSYCAITPAYEATSCWVRGLRIG
jgi:hypothetical protein